MYNKKLGKAFACCALAMALAVAATPASAFAAKTEVNTTAGGNAGELTGIDPTAQDNAETVGVDESYADTDIDVWALSENTKYSVDVEWGAMTFEYKADWNATSHQMENGEWKIYDSTANAGAGAAIDDKANAINRVTVTNHSNAPVYAKLSYAGETAPTDYSETTGAFSKATGSTDATATADAKSEWNATENYFTLQSAADAAGGAGAPAVGNIYFMPNGISNAVKTAGIEKWTKIGKITVALLTTEPTTP